MKSVIITGLIIFFFTIPGFCQQTLQYSYRTQSYYGFTGLSFIPTAQTLTKKQINISYSSKPAKGQDVLLEPFSLQISIGALKEGLEFAVTNTPIYASEEEFEGVKLINSTLPIVPSVKYQFMPMTKENHYVAMAGGFGWPYGSYYVVDKFFNAKIFDITLHSGVATKLVTYHTFVGATVTFGNRIGEIQRDFPLEMLLEASWGGSLKQLDKKEEGFFAISFRQAWTSSLFIHTFFRIDGATKYMGLGLDLNWNL